MALRTAQGTTHRGLLWSLVLVTSLAVVGSPALSSQSPTIDGLFEQFFAAPSPDAAAALVAPLANSGVSFDEALARLSRGRAYAGTAPRGLVQGRYVADGTEYFYTLDVPETYDPSRRYQLRVQLHGGVGRLVQSAPPTAAQRTRLAGAEQIYLSPYAWRDAPWWSRRQQANLRVLVDLAKRTYNIDENRVVLSGVSDGGTGAYFEAMRDTTPFASFLPLNGFVMVLGNEMAQSDGDVFANNLRNKPIFAVNGGKDPLYPTRVVDPYIEHLKAGGVDITYLPQPEAGHDTSWWPVVRDPFEQFVASHPRRPLPDTLTWETNEVPSRAHWVVVEELRSARDGEAMASDLNARASRPYPEFGIRSSGRRIHRVLAGSNAEQIGLRPGDAVTAISGIPVSEGTDLEEMLQGVPPGRPLIFTVDRAGTPVRLTGRYAPAAVPAVSQTLLPPSKPSGRVDVTRIANTVTIAARGVAAVTLLLSPAQFDLSRPLTVVVNGRSTEHRLSGDLKTLLKWAASDNDRTMLFGAELRVAVP